MDEYTIPIPINEDIAQAYYIMSDEKRRKIEILFSIILKRYVMNETNTPKQSFEEIMDDIGLKAEQRGLTPELLEQLLQDDNE
jgi:hypothetical protein